MSDTMLIGVLRMPVDDHGDLALIQLIGRAQEAADRIESDGRKIDQLREALEEAVSEVEVMKNEIGYRAATIDVIADCRAALKATEE